MSRIDSIRELLASSPDDIFLLYSLGMELLGAGQAAEAVEQFNGLLQKDPDYLPAYLQLAQALQATGDKAAATEVLGRGIALAERQADGHIADRLRLVLNGLRGAG